MDRGGTRRTEQRRRFDHRGVAAEIEVRRAALDLAPQEGIQDDVADVDPSDGTIAVHQDAQPGRTPELDRTHRRFLSPEVGVPRSISSMPWFTRGPSGDGSRSSTAMLPGRLCEATHSRVKASQSGTGRACCTGCTPKERCSCRATCSLEVTAAIQTGSRKRAMLLTVRPAAVGTTTAADVPNSRTASAATETRS